MATVDPGEVSYGDTEQRRLAAFIGLANHVYYLDKWDSRLRGGSGGTGFNWPAFFLTGLWVAYRKMYGAAAVLGGILLVETLGEEIIFVGVLGKPAPPDALGTVVTIVVAVVCGCYGNRWYLNHACDAVSKQSRECPPEDVLLGTLAERGGTSIAAAVWIFLLFVVLEFATVVPLDLLLQRQ
jgi:uncharacterized protein DUF2628